MDLTLTQTPGLGDRGTCRPGPGRQHAAVTEDDRELAPAHGLVDGLVREGGGAAAQAVAISMLVNTSRARRSIVA